MKGKMIAACGLILGLTLAGMATANDATSGQTSAAGFLSEYSSGSREVKDLSEIQAEEAADGMLVASVAVAIQRNEKGLICQPPDLMLKGSQAISIFEQWLPSHSQYKDDPWEIDLFRSLQDAFPCK